ncbi:porin family protein [Maribacter polysiphoniae]|uniref:porin family protein n=1 Tax=Maribacter polysiphoniae TaxID=429344 RepID=UPI0023527BF7|nr:porin family protein [Maribacter polysiphoniae]
MKQLILGLFLCCTVGLYAQDNQEFETLDSRYLEDQFYLGITYNFFRDKPADFTQRNLSYGLQGGIIKDIPVNSSRTFAIGIGLGYAVNSYYSNLWASKTSEGIDYSLIDDDEIVIDDETIQVDRNKLETHVLELPLELRWRNSTLEEYKFTRIYAGMKFGYIFAARSKLVTDVDKTSFANPDIAKFQYGIMLNIGYNTFNAHIYYSLSNLFEDGPTIGTESINLKPLRIGFIFYIL